MIPYDRFPGRIIGGMVVDLEKPHRREVSGASCPWQVSCGPFHCATVTSDGYLFTWGDGLCGKLGHGDQVACPSPRQVGHSLVSPLVTKGGLCFSLGPDLGFNEFRVSALNALED